MLDPDNEQQYIVWGIGGLGETAFRHFTRAQGKVHHRVLVAGKHSLGCEY